MRDKFEISIDDLASLKSEYPNIEEQVRGALHLVQNTDASAACVFLLSSPTSYFPAKLTQNQEGNIEITPLIALHGITGTHYLTSVDPYDDLKEILDKGLRKKNVLQGQNPMSHHSGTYNSYLLEHNNDGIYPRNFLEWAHMSRKEDTEGDLYFLEIHEMSLTGVRLFPFNRIGAFCNRDNLREPLVFEQYGNIAYLKHNVPFANPADMTVIVLLSPVTPEGLRTRFDYYEGELGLSNIKYVFCGQNIGDVLRQ